MSDHGVFEAIAEWALPLGPIAVCVGSTLTAIVLTRRTAAWIAGTSGGVVAYQAIPEACPTVLWLGAGMATALAAHAYRSSGRPLQRAVVNAARNAALAASVGVAAVVAVELTLAHLTAGHAERVEEWNRMLALTRAELERVVLLGPTRLAVLLAAVVAAVAVSPSLRVMQRYRATSRVTSHALLSAVVASSFTFFAGSHALAWQRDWIAVRGRDLRGQLEDIDRANAATLKRAAVEDALRSIPEAQRAEVRRLEAEIQAASGRRSDAAALREAIVERIVERLVDHGADGRSGRPISERVRAAASQAERAPPRLAAEPATERALRHIRRVEIAPEEIEPVDIEILGVERTRARAVLEEAGAASRELVGAVLEGDSLLARLVQPVIDSIRIEPPRLNRLLDDNMAMDAMLAAEPPPAVWIFDASPGGALQAPLPSLRDIEALAAGFEAEQQAREVARAKVASRRLAATPHIGGEIAKRPRITSPSAPEPELKPFDEFAPHESSLARLRREIERDYMREFGHEFGGDLAPELAAPGIDEPPPILKGRSLNLPRERLPPELARWSPIEPRLSPFRFTVQGLFSQLRNLLRRVRPRARPHRRSARRHRWRLNYQPGAA